MSAQRFSASRPGQHCRQASTNIQLVAAWLPAAAPCLLTSASVQLQCCGQTSGWPQAQVRHQGRQQALEAGLVKEARGAAGASVKQEAAVQRAHDLGQQSGVGGGAACGVEVSDMESDMLHLCFLPSQSNTVSPCLPSKSCPQLSRQPSMSMEGGGWAPTLRRRRQSCSAYNGSSARAAAAPAPPSSAAAAAASDLRFFFLLFLAAAATDPSARRGEPTHWLPAPWAKPGGQLAIKADIAGSRRAR